MRALAIKFLWLGFGVALSIAPAPVAADVDIVLKDGRIFSLPIDSGDIKDIEVDGTSYGSDFSRKRKIMSPDAGRLKPSIYTRPDTGRLKPPIYTRPGQETSNRESQSASAVRDLPKTRLIDLPDEDGRGFFLDDKTGYKWHDIDNFVGMTLSEMLKAVEGTGFHLATRAEVEELQSHIVLSLRTFAAVDDIMGGTFTYRDRSSTPGAKRIIWGRYDDGLPLDTGKKRGTTSIRQKGSKSSRWGFRAKRANYTNPALGAFVVRTSIDP